MRINSALLAGVVVLSAAIAGCAHNKSSSDSMTPSSHDGSMSMAQPTTMPSNAATYYCPMHADVVSNQPGKCPKCGMDLVRKS
jgi:hypothetical protein